jgi:Tol biopolymer transport system component
MKKKHEEGILTKSLQNSYMSMTTQRFKKCIFGVKPNPRRQKMKRKSAWFGLIGLLLTAALLGAISQTGEDLFQKALRLERNEGKLMEAIELYNRVVAEEGNKDIAAQAQLRIGLCYEKLGQKSVKQAQDAFQKVIDNFPGHMEVVKVAREKLSGIQASKSGFIKKSSDFTIRKVLSGVEDGLGEVSPDGHYLSCIDWSTGDLAVQDLVSEKKRRLTNKGSWLTSDAMAFQSRWSPDGKHIVFDWWDWNDPKFVGIRIIEPDGSNLRDLYRSKIPDEDVNMVYDWSPDGKDILASLWSTSGSGQIVLISVSDSTTRVLKKFDSSRIQYNKTTNMTFSPCGNYVVYDFPAADSGKSDIYVLPKDGGSEIPLIEHPANDLLLGWTPDGDNVLFLSDRRGTTDIWILPVRAGKANGVPVLLREGVGKIASQGFTKEGAFYYVTTKSAENVYVVPLDSISGRVLESPKLPIEHLGKSTHSPDYSPDRKHLAYVSVRGPVGNERFVICIHSLESGKDREFYPGHNFWNLKWSPDSRSLLALASDKEDRTGHQFLARIDVETGKATQILRCEKERVKQFVRTAVWSPDGKTIYYVFNDREKWISRLIARDLETGKEKELYRAPDWAERFLISGSPDGKWLSLLNYKGSEENTRSIKIIPTSGGDIRELYSFQNVGNWPARPAWSPDSNYVLFCKPTSETDPTEDKSDLWRIPIDGGDPQKLGLTMYRFYHLSVHPDGKHLAFGSLGPELVEPELWVMENFLPKSEGMKK